MSNIVSGYFLLVFLSSIGVLQIAAAYAKLEGLFFFKRAFVGYIFGVLLIGGTFTWFFTVHSYNMPTVVEGWQQFGLFLAGIVAAFLLTATISSLIKLRAFPHREADEGGIEELKGCTYFQALAQSWRRNKK
jgi:energy-coupling factor transporter transmembrane protein EcfT